MNTPLIILGFLVFLALCLVIYVVACRFGKKMSSAVKEQVRREWHKIQQNKDAKHAILEADKLLHFALQQHGYTGPMGEKLKKARAEFTNIDGLWKAHKVRNQIAHEIGYQVSPKLRKECLAAFKGALEDLEVL